MPAACFENIKMEISINTVAFKTGSLTLAEKYIKKYGDRVGFEILPKFDEDIYEQDINSALDILRGREIAFHDVTFLAEHSAKRGTAEYEQTMKMMRQIIPYCRELNCSHLTMHLNNCVIPEEEKEERLKNALENISELKEIFSPIPFWIENTGTEVGGNILLDEEEFISLCKEKKFDVLFDIGHASANGWNLYRVIDELKGQIRGYHIHNNDGRHDLHSRFFDGVVDYDRLLPYMKEMTPEAEWIVEYCNTELEKYLIEDIDRLLEYKKKA